MRAATWLSFLALAAPVFGAYSYYVSDPFNAANAGAWQANGPVSYAAGGLSSIAGGSLISKIPVPDPNPAPVAYEVAAMLRIPASGGRYIVYLSASQDAKLTDAGAVGTFYAAEIWNPTHLATGGCTANLYLWKSVNSSLSLLSSSSITCKADTQLRAVARGGLISVNVNNTFQAWVSENNFSGMPGVGIANAPAANFISIGQLGVADRVAPSAVSRESIGTSLFPNSVQMRWPTPGDGASGTGVVRFDVYRPGVVVGYGEGGFVDDLVQPGTTYTYTIHAIDYHFNYSPPTTVTVTTPPAGAVNPVQVGVRSTGTYWGAAGEQIDLRSGNLNFTLPLASAKGRGGSGLTAALSYNSQQWRLDSAGVWKLGSDVGYGFGFRFQAGSITPYYRSQFDVGHYKFVDSTGAEYRLDVPGAVAGNWRSREGAYVTYDAPNRRLRFNDGSFWQMDCTSLGDEQDAGTLYPTLMQDSNGNQIRLNYHAGVGVPFVNSSARLEFIEDVRAVWNATRGVYWTYSFQYGDIVVGGQDYGKHLLSVTSHVGSGESHNFYYYTIPALSSPFGGTATYGTTLQLQSVAQVGTNLTYTFEYPAVGAEIARIVLPYGGWLRYEYGNADYAGGRTVREVRRRHLKWSASSPCLNRPEFA